MNLASNRASRRPRAVASLFRLVAACALLGCGNGDGGGITPPGGDVVSVSLTAVSTSLPVGGGLQAVATARNSSNETLTSTTFTWSSSNPAIAGVTQSGLVTGVALGSATITATGGGKSGTLAITVKSETVGTGASGVPTLLPTASRQLPNFAAYPGQGLSAGQSYNDPVTGVKIWKLTDPSVTRVNGQHDYSSGPVQISRDWGSNQHTVLYADGEGRWGFVDFQRGVGLSNRRAAPSANHDIAITFSLNEATPRIAYYVIGNTIRRYNTATNQEEAVGNFPHTFTGVGDVGWLQQDKNDAWFVMMTQNHDRVIAWNAQTNQTIMQTPAQLGVAQYGLDEPHLERDGRFVAVVLGAEVNTGNGRVNWISWDLSNNSHTLPKRIGVHFGALRSAFVASDPDVDNGPQWRADVSTGTVTEILSASKASPDLQHRADQWIQSDATLGGTLFRQWALLSSYNDGIVIPTEFSVVSGNIYRSGMDWTATYEKRLTGVHSVRQWIAGGAVSFARQLTEVNSQGAMSEGTFWYDAANQRVSVWAVGGGNPAGRVTYFAPNAVHDAIAFYRADGSDVRLLAHHYSNSPTYWDTPRATMSPDGKIVVFDSNMNQVGGRSEAFLIEVPLQ